MVELFDKCTSSQQHNDTQEHKQHSFNTLKFSPRKCGWVEMSRLRPLASFSPGQRMTRGGGDCRGGGGLRPVPGSRGESPPTHRHIEIAM